MVRSDLNAEDASGRTGDRTRVQRPLIWLAAVQSVSIAASGQLAKETLPGDHHALPR